MTNEVRLIERMKGFWEKHFKPHCPDCGGVMDDEMLEFTRFNNWWYGTSYDSVRSDGIVNIGVFNPAGVRQLLDRPDCDVKVYWIVTCDKNRMLRQLSREVHPDVREIVRRFDADYQDFSDIDFDYLEIQVIEED